LYLIVLILGLAARLLEYILQQHEYVHYIELIDIWLALVSEVPI
jgi:hypothetical protein